MSLVIFMELKASFCEANGKKLGWSLSYKLFYINAGNCYRLFLSIETLLNYIWNLVFMEIMYGCQIVF